MEQIIVVDDDTEIREFMGNILKSAGYQVREASDGGSALKLLRQEPVDLLVTDIVMPIKEGIETIRCVKKRFPATKIIATSGFDFYLEMAGRLGADRTFEKPFDIEDFLSTVRTLLRAA